MMPANTLGMFAVRIGHQFQRPQQGHDDGLHHAPTARHVRKHDQHVGHQVDLQHRQIAAVDRRKEDIEHRGGHEHVGRGDADLVERQAERRHRHRPAKDLQRTAMQEARAHIQPRHRQQQDAERPRIGEQEREPMRRRSRGCAIPSQIFEISWTVVGNPQRHKDKQHARQANTPNQNVKARITSNCTILSSGMFHDE